MDGHAEGSSSRRSVPDSLVDLWTGILDLAIQAITLVLGVLGAIAFFWEFRQGRARRVRVLNRSVFRPWSKVEVKLRHRSYDGRPAAAIRLTIPADAVREGVDPTVKEDGLDLADLPGFADGEHFLKAPRLSRLSRPERSIRAACRRASLEWEAVAESSRKYEAARERRRSILEPMIAGDMKRAYPSLRAVPYHDYDVNTYILANVLGKAEDETDWSLLPGKREVHVSGSRSSTSSADLFVIEITESYPLMKADERLVPNAVAFTDLLKSWVSAAPVKEAALEMAGYFERVSEAADRFRAAMKDIVFAIDLEFPTHES